MPANASPDGGIFSGWLLSRRDLGGGVPKPTVAGGRVATVAIEAMSLVAPVNVAGTVTG